MNASSQATLTQSMTEKVILNLCSLFLWVVVLFSALFLYQYLSGLQMAEKFLINCALALLTGTTAFCLAKRGRSLLAACVLMASIFTVTAYTSVSTGLGLQAPLVMNLTLLTLISSFCLGRRWSWALTLVNCLFLIALFVLEIFDKLPTGTVRPFSPSANTMGQLVALFLFSYLIGHALQKRNELALSNVEANNLALEKALGDKARANKAKDSFLDMMSHEIRTPMAGIRTAIELLKDPRTSEQKRERYLKAIDTSTASLLSLLNDMLNTTQMEAGEISVVENSFSVGALLLDTANLFELAAQQKQLTLVVERSESLNTQVIGDSARLRQMLSNLLGNAVKYTHTGHIGLSATQQALDSETDTWVFTVTDTGPGLCSADQQRLFKAHTRLQNATDSNEEGSGLGLSIVKRLADAMGGTVGARSALGKGSAFWIQIPLKRIA